MKMARWSGVKVWYSLMEDFWRSPLEVGSSSHYLDLGVSKNNGTPKSSILIGFSIINHLFWGTPILETFTACFTSKRWLLLRIFEPHQHLWLNKFFAMFFKNPGKKTMQNEYENPRN